MATFGTRYGTRAKEADFTITRPAGAGNSKLGLLGRIRYKTTTTRFFDYLYCLYMKGTAPDAIQIRLNNLKTETNRLTFKTATGSDHLEWIMNRGRGRISLYDVVDDKMYAYKSVSNPGDRVSSLDIDKDSFFKAPNYFTTVSAWTQYKYNENTDAGNSCLILDVKRPFYLGEMTPTGMSQTTGVYFDSRLSGNLDPVAIYYDLDDGLLYTLDRHVKRVFCYDLTKPAGQQYIEGSSFDHGVDLSGIGNIEDATVSLTASRDYFLICDEHPDGETKRRVRAWHRSNTTGL